MGMVIFSGSALTPLWCTFVKILSFTILVQRDKSNWPRCLLWHGWLPALAYPGGRSPWAETAEDVVTNRLEGDVLREWVRAQGMEGGLTASRVPQFPKVWTDGSLVSDDLAGIAAAGAVYLLNVSGSCWFRRRCGAFGHATL